MLHEPQNANKKALTICRVENEQFVYQGSIEIIEVTFA